MNVQRILEVLIRRRVLIVITSVLVFIGAVAAAFTLPALYEASSLIYINNANIVGPLVNKVADTPNMREELNTLSKQVLAWARMEQLVTQLRLAEHIKSPSALNDFITDLRKRVSVDPRGRDLIQISFRDRVPATAQRVVNTITQNFMDENVRLKKEDARNAIEFIESQLKIYQEKLEKSQANFSSNKVASELRVLQNRRRLTLERLAVTPKYVASQVTREQNPVVARLQNRYAEVQSELTRLKMDAKPGNPKIAELEKQRDQIKTFLDSEMEKETVKESVSIMNPAYLQNEQDLKQVDLDLEFLLRRQREIKQEPAAPQAPVSEDELANIERGKKVDEDIYQALLRQLESAYLSEHLQESEKGARFTVIEYGRLPLKPVSPKRGRLILMGLLAGLGAGVGLAFLIEQLDGSFKTIDEAKGALTLEFLGVVSKLVPARPVSDGFFARLRQAYENFMNRHQVFTHLRLVAPTPLVTTSPLPIAPQVVTIHQPQSMVMEEYHVIESAIAGMLTTKPLVLMVTSSLKGEGKSTTAANLAVSMARAKKNTVLIDADMRRGTVHDIFGVTQNPGLTEVLSGAATLDAALTPARVDNLTILPRGTSSHNTFYLIKSPQMAETIAALKKRFDVIIIDAPPVLGLPDTRLLSAQADGVVMAVQAERTQKKDVINAQKTLEQAHAKLLGFILTNVQYYVPRSLYQYYYYSEY